MNRAVLWFLAIAASSFVAKKAYGSIGNSRAKKKIQPDVAGNYDIDGVSYDKAEHEVTVSGDASREVFHDSGTVRYSH